MYCAVKLHYIAMLKVQKTPWRNRKNFLRWIYKWEKHAQIDPNFYQLFRVLWKVFVRSYL